MIPRQIRPGVVILVDENTALRELMLQERPGGEPTRTVDLSGCVFPGSSELVLADSAHDVVIVDNAPWSLTAPSDE